MTIIPQRHRRTPFCSNTALCIALRDKKLRLNAVAYFVCESCRQLYSESSKNFFCLQFIAVLFTVLFITAIKETTGLTDLPSLIADRRHSLFIHICRLSRDTPVSQALRLSIDAFTGTPATDWKRPRRTWLQQVEDMGLPISACQFTTLDRSLWRSLRPSVGRAQQ